MVANENIRKNIAAVTVAPLAIIPAIILYGLLTLIFQEGADANALFAGSGLLMAVILVIAYPVTLICGPISVVILKRFNRFTLINTLLISVIASSITSLFMDFDLKYWLISAYLAISVAVTYWLVYKRFFNEI